MTPNCLKSWRRSNKAKTLGSSPACCKLTGRKPEEAFREVMQEIGELISIRTQTLADEMVRLEGELSKEMKTLFGELQALESLKQSYGTHFASFTVDAAVARAFLERPGST